MQWRSLVALGYLVFPACSTESPAAVAGPGAPPSCAPRSSAVSADLDPRRDVPLLPVMAAHQKTSMREHLGAIQAIVSAMATGDFAAVERAAGRIGSSDQMQQMCSHMGLGAPEFTEQALAFHRTADRIVEAARERDTKRTLAELGATLDACTSCHATWKQRVVDDATWASLSRRAPSASTETPPRP